MTIDATSPRTRRALLAGSVGSAAALVIGAFARPLSGTAATRVSGVKTLFVHYADAGNVTTGDTDMYVDKLAARQLAKDGDSIEYFASGLWTFPDTANGQIRAYYGGALIFDTTSLNINSNGGWSLRIVMVRSSPTAMRVFGSFVPTRVSDYLFDSNRNIKELVTEIGGLTHSDVNSLKIMGQVTGIGAGTNQIIAKLGTIRYYPTP